MVTKVEIAGVPLELRHRYPQPAFSGFLTDKTPLFSLGPTQEDLDAEGQLLSYEAPEPERESNWFYRSICMELTRYGCFLIHGAVVELDGVGYVFTARSGVGKSTHCGYWLRAFPGRAKMLNGDKPILRLTEDGFYVCGSPWQGKENLGYPGMAPLKALCLLERSPENHIQPAPASMLMERLFQQLLMPEDPELSMKQIDLLDALVRTVPIYRLGCNQSVEAALVAYEAMK